jgi:sugar lactone lactonase YvrE
MPRVLSLAVVLLASAVGRAQDMPLSQILIDGEGWKKAAAAPPPAIAHVTTRSPDGSTTLTWRPECEGFVYACQTKAGPESPFSPYCPLRVKRGEKPLVTALTTDKDGRIYAATPLGVQVFDPTGRLCGVLTPTETGSVEALAFAGSELVAWVGDVRYTRKLKTTGVK